MKSILIIGNILGILNSGMLIIYPLLSKKGNRKSNYLFSAFMLSLSMILCKPFYAGITGEIINSIFIVSIIGTIAISLVYYLFVQSVIAEDFKLKTEHIFLLLPLLLLIAAWFFVGAIQTNYKVWNAYHRIMMLVFIAYLTLAVFKVNSTKFENANIKKQLNIFSILLFMIWFTGFLHELSGLKYLEEFILYSFTIYLTLRIIYNKGFIIEPSSEKYKKTGLKEDEKERILKQFKLLFEVDHLYRENTISLGKTAKRIGTNIHALSQVINESYKKSFFEILRYYRISEAEKVLLDEPELKISDVAFQIGYNSLSAFNTAFKEQTGKTPSKFRNEKE